MAIAKEESLRELRKAPGIGERMALDLYGLGVRSLDELKKQDPEKLYNGLCVKSGGHVDRCVLYVFRCAVYFARCKRHDPKLLKWWNWKDRTI
ncbi:MAG: pathogenicity locus [Deltaproteobacteria bacterium]|nr:pathogenicity locus [Deltaproteobacteria bacterium]